MSNRRFLWDVLTGDVLAWGFMASESPYTFECNEIGEIENPTIFKRALAAHYDTLELQAELKGEEYQSDKIVIHDDFENEEALRIETLTRRQRRAPSDISSFMVYAYTEIHEQVHALNVLGECGKHNNLEQENWELAMYRFDGLPMGHYVPVKFNFDCWIGIDNECHVLYPCSKQRFTKNNPKYWYW